MMKNKLILFFGLLQFISFSNNSFKKIEFKGDILNLRKIEKYKNNYIGKEINSENLSNLLQGIEDILKKEGFIDSKAIFKSGNINTGEILIEINISKVKNIEIFNENQEKILNNKKIDFAFGKYKDKYLNIRNLDQGIENLNVRGQKHILKLIPIEDGYYNIEILEKKSKEHFVALSLDNNTLKEKTINFSINYEKTNFIGINDSLKLGFITELQKDIVNNNKNIFSLNYSFPYAKYRFDYNLNVVLNNSKIPGIKKDFYNKIIEVNNEINLNTLLYRNTVSKLDTDLSLSIKNKKSKIVGNSETNGIKIDNQNFTLLNFDAKLGYKTEILKGDLNLDTILSYSRKLSLKSDQKIALKLRANYNRSQKIGENIYMNFDSLLGFDIANNDEQIISNVRGFEKNVLNGKYIVFSKNTLDFRVSSTNEYISGINPYVGLDFGITEQGNIVGSTIGFRYNIKNIILNASYSRSLKTASVKDLPENIFKFNISLLF